jgi:hypothetical protein
VKNIILKFSGILLLGQLLNYWLLFYSPWNIPEFIPGTPISIAGLLLMLLTITILILAQRQILKKKNDLSIIKLALHGAIICFVAEFFFQIIRWPTITADSTYERAYYCFRGILIVPAFSAVYSLLIAVQLKTGRARLVIWIIVAFFLSVGLLKYLFPSFFLTHITGLK